MPNSELRELSEGDVPSGRPPVETGRARALTDDAGWGDRPRELDDDPLDDGTSAAAVERMTDHVFDTSASARAGYLAGGMGGDSASLGDATAGEVNDSTTLPNPQPPHEASPNDSLEAAPLLRPLPPYEVGDGSDEAAPILRPTTPHNVDDF